MRFRSLQIRHCKLGLLGQQKLLDLFGDWLFVVKAEEHDDVAQVIPKEVPCTYKMPGSTLSTASPVPFLINAWLRLDFEQDLSGAQPSLQLAVSLRRLSQGQGQANVEF